MSDNESSSSRPRINPQPIYKIGKSERTRAVILDAALEFIWKYPFRDMTVKVIMDSAGLSRSTFYQYFDDLHDLMETLLNMLKDEIFAATGSWFTGVGDPIIFVKESLAGLVDVCYRLGPILRATVDAAASDKRLEEAWFDFIGDFDDAATARIEADQQQGLIPNFDARSVAFALNRLDAYTLIEAFGQRPRSKPEPVLAALTRIWISTLYGSEHLGKKSQSLCRT